MPPKGSSCNKAIEKAMMVAVGPGTPDLGLCSSQDNLGV